MRTFTLRLLLPLLLLVAWSVAPAAQNSGSSSSSAPQNPNDSSGQQQQQQPPPPQQQPPPPPPDQSKKKKDKKDKGSQDPVNTEVFSTAAANSVLNDLRDGLEGHTQRLMLSAFDADKMDGYLQFEDQIEAFFNKYTSFTVYFRIAQTATDGPKGIVLVDIQLEENPRGAAPPVRKSGQMRFELERGKKGWKIVDFSPRNFFS
ncbi:MAG: hypothetical protein WA188_21195 [Terriglobales bacterium]